MKIKKYISTILLFTPFISLAYEIEDIDTLLFSLALIINKLMAFLIAVAVVWFLFGVVKYITAGGDAEKQKEGRNTIMWGIVVLFVMLSVWGFVWILLNTFNLNIAAPTPPQL